MTREKKFNFIPERQLDAKIVKERKPGVSISKGGQMIFNASSLEEYGLVGRFIRMYGDPEKKAIAFHIFDGANGLEDLHLKKIERNKTGIATLSVGRLLRKIGVKLEKSLRGLPIQKYEDLMDNKTFFYIIVKETVPEESEEPTLFPVRRRGRPRKSY